MNAKGLQAAPIRGLQSDHFLAGADQIDEVLSIFDSYPAGDHDNA